MNERTFQKTLDLLKEFSQVWANNVPLPTLFTGGYWQAFQQSMFFDIKRGYDFSPTAKPFLVHAQEFFISFILLVYSLLSLLYTKVSGKEWIIVYTNDAVIGKRNIDQRLTPLYETLEAEKKDYFEFIHSIPSKKTLQNLWKRKRACVYIEACDYFISFFTHTPTLTVASDSYFAGLAQKYWQIFHVRQKRQGWLRFCLRFLKSSRAFMLDDIRNYQELIGACKKKNIVIYGMQHGHFTKYHVGWLTPFGGGEVVSPDYLLLWSDYWKQELLSLGTYFTEDQLRVGGLKFKSQRLPHTTAGEDIRLLLVYEIEAPFEEVKKYIEKIRNTSGLTLLFKPRPDMDVGAQLSRYGLKNVTVHKDLEEAARNTDVAIGTYSTILYEFVERGLPVAMLETSSDFGEGIVRNNLGVKIGLDDISTERLSILVQQAKDAADERAVRLTSPGLLMKESVVELLK